jgi:phage terminase large subunit-like protein
MTTATLQRTELSRAEEMAHWPRRERDLFFMSLSKQEAQALRWDWRFWARPKQLAPPGDWSVWIALAGRGFGKTRLGAEWVRHMVCDPTDPKKPGRASRIALIGETAADVRDVMVKGNGGILAVHPPEFRPIYIESKRRLEWPNGAMALTFSAEEPDQLRGPEHDLAWCDELAKWRYAQDTWDMLQFGLRLGNPQTLVTTTPRPIDLVRDIMKGEKTGDTVVTRGSTYDNASNLSAKFIANVRKKYEGSRLGRQELHAELLDDVPGALWTRRMLDRRSGSNPFGAGMNADEALPQMKRIVVGVDPSGSTGDNGPKARSRQDKSVSDLVGIVVAGIDHNDVGYILEDATSDGGPAEWATAVVEAYKRWDADLVVAESNFGGAMVEYTIRSVSRRIPVQMIHASRGKAIRAEPISMLYEQGKVRHYAAVPELEDQMCSMTKTGYVGSTDIGKSPDRLDAGVWALTELMLGELQATGGQAGVSGLM